MARKKSSDSAGALVLLLFAALVAVLATLITFASAAYGFVALVAWNFYTRKSNRIPVALSAGYFIATRAESRSIVELEKSLADTRKELSGLVSEGRGLTRRIDGEYDERSGLGKNLNREISGSRSSESSMVVELSTLRNYSYQRRLHYLKIKAAAAAWRKAGFAYITAIVGFLIYTPSWVAELNQFLNKSGSFGQIKQVPLLWGILAAAAIISIAVQQVMRLYCKYSLQRRLELGVKPDKHVAVRFTELLAAQSGVGLYESDDLSRAEVIFKEREATKKAPDAVAELQPVSKPSAGQQFRPAPPMAESASPAITASSSTKAAAPAPVRLKRALWKRLATAVIFGLIGLVSGFITFGLSGQGNFGVVAILILPIVGLAWGFNFRKYSQKVKPT